MAKSQDSDRRAQRLAAKLRENLQRRKAQARARALPPEPQSQPTPDAPADKPGETDR